MMVPILHLLSHIGSQMIQFSQFLSEQSLRSKQMQQIDALIPQYIKHFDNNPIQSRGSISIPHPLYKNAKLDISGRSPVVLEGNPRSIVSLDYDREDDHPEKIAGAVNHSIAFALAAMHHIHKTDPRHTFIMIPRVKNSLNRQSTSHTRLYSNLVQAINSGTAGPNLSRFTGEIGKSALQHFIIRKRQDAPV